MKTKFMILGGLALTGVGIWYLFFRDRQFSESGNQNPVGMIQKEESGVEHIRQVFHKAKELVPEMAYEISSDHR
jgi:hypothetical protein